MARWRRRRSPGGLLVPEAFPDLLLLAALLLPLRLDDEEPIAADSAAVADVDGGGRRFPPRMRLTEVPPWRVAAPSPISAPSEDLVRPGAFRRADDPEAVEDIIAPDPAGPALDCDTGP